MTYFEIFSILFFWVIFVLLLFSIFICFWVKIILIAFKICIFDCHFSFFMSVMNEFVINFVLKFIMMFTIDFCNSFFKFLFWKLREYFWHSSWSSLFMYIILSYNFEKIKIENHLFNISWFKMTFLYKKL